MNRARQETTRTPNRRRWLRIVGVGAALACVDRATGPGSQAPARLTLRLHLPAATPASWRPPGDSLVIVIRRAGRTTPIADTALVASEPLTGAITVPLSLATEGFVASGEVRAGGTTYFLGFDAIQLRAGGDTTIDLDARYVGPAAAAASLEIVPVRPGARRGDTVTVLAIARDSAGQPMTSAPVRFVSDQGGAVRVSVGGVVTIAAASPFDTVRVRGFLPTGVTGSALVRVLSSGGGPTGRETIAFISARDGVRALYIMEGDGSNGLRVTHSTSAEHRPAWSPDRRTIAFERDVNGASQLFAIAPDGSGERALTSSGSNTGARWSPDGRRIAFTSTRGGTAEVWIMNADGSGQRRLVDPQSGSDDFGDWSPDGAQIVVLHRDAPGSTRVLPERFDSSGAPLAEDVRAIGAFGEGRVDVVAARWSPLGNLVAFTTAGGGTRVIVSPLSGFTTIPFLGAPNDGESGAAWAASGSQVVFEGGESAGPRGIYAAPLGGTSTRLSPAGTADFEPDWVSPSPAIYVDHLVVTPSARSTTSDGSATLTMTVSGIDARGASVPVGVTLRNASAGELATLDSLHFTGVAPGRGYVSASFAGWRIDSAYVDVLPAIGANAQEMVALYGSTLVRVRADGGGRTVILAGDTVGIEPAVSPDGSLVAFHARVADANDDIVVMGIDGTGMRRLTTDPGSDGQPAWSPDGRRIVFASNRVGFRYHLFVMNADGTGQRQLTTSQAEEVDPAWSPDGSLIAFARVTPSVSALAAITPDGAPRALADATGAGLSGRFPAWTPDGSALLWSDGTPSRIWRMSMSARTPAPITDGVARIPGNPFGDLRPAVASDGTIAFSSTRFGNEQQLVMRGDGTGISGVLPLFDGSRYGSWRLTTPPRYAAAIAVTGDVASPLAVGATRTFAASARSQSGAAITPVGGFAWSAPDPAIATVDSAGAVTGRSAGTARIVVATGIATPDTLTLTIASAAVATTRAWVGGDPAGATRWSIAGNWSPAGVPTSLDSVTIGAAASQPTLDAGVAIAALDLAGVGARLTLGGHALHVARSARIGSSGGLLVMTSAADTLDVRGDVTFGGEPAGSSLSAGVIRVGGDFGQYYVGSDWEDFAASGTLVVILDGAALQHVHFDNPGEGGQSSRFHDLVIANEGGVEIGTDVVVAGTLRLTTPVPLSGGGTLTVADSLVSTAGSTVAPARLRLGGGMAVSGAAGASTTEFFGVGQTIQPGLAYRDVLVSGTASLAGRTAASGGVTVVQAVQSRPARLTMAGQTFTVAGAFQTGGRSIGGALVMTSAADTLDVRGDATFAGDPTPRLLTAGVLRVGGNFAQYYVGSNWGDFLASGAHRVIFDGSTPQRVHFDDPGISPFDQASHFAHLTIANPAGVELATDVVASGTMYVTAPAPVSGAGTLTVHDTIATASGSAVSVAVVWVGGPLAVAGAWSPGRTVFFGAGQTVQPGLAYRDLVIGGTASLAGTTSASGDVSIGSVVGNPTTPARLTFAGHTLHVGGSFGTGRNGTGGTISGAPVMQNAADTLDVRGDVTFAGDPTPGLLTAGVLRVGGNFAQYYLGSNWGDFIASSTHRVVFDGSAPQTVHFDDPGISPFDQASHFAHVVIADGASVTFTTDAVASGSLELIGLLAIPTGVTADVVGDLTLRAGSTLTNAGTLKYGGAYQHQGATITGNAPIPR